MTRRLARLAMSIVVCAVLIMLTAPAPRAAGIHQVPQGYSTIQSAIAAAANGDTVRVAAGTYHERIDFLGKTITVESTAGAEATIIDADGGGAVVTISVSAGQQPVLRGFTIRGGGLSTFAGGINLSGGSTLVENNIVTANDGCLGGGISVQFSAATIRNNLISKNTMLGCSGGNGGGIRIGGAGTVHVERNVIVENASDTDGGGIALFAAGQPVISANVITSNVAEGLGGGISLLNQSDALIVNNVIASNRSNRGGGIGWLVPSGATGPNVVNNTLALNTAPQGSAVYAEGFQGSARLSNNILFSVGDAWTMECSALYGSALPVIRYNDVINFGGPGLYGGACADQTGVNGNISADPLFVGATTGDFHLKSTSRAIDAGELANAPAADIDGDVRPRDGNGDGVARVDIGADEAPVPTPPDTVPPTITAPATVSANATMPSGATVTYAVQVVDNVDPAPALSCLPQSGSLFGMGSTIVNCTATDATGNRSTASFSVFVKGADTQLAEMATLIESWNLGKVGRTLLSKIDSTRRSLATGKRAQACSTLTALLADIAASTNKGLTPAQAGELNTRTLRIKGAVGC